MQEVSEQNRAGDGARATLQADHESIRATLQAKLGEATATLQASKAREGALEGELAATTTRADAVASELAEALATTAEWERRATAAEGELASLRPALDVATRQAADAEERLAAAEQQQSASAVELGRLAQTVEQKTDACSRVELLMKAAEERFAHTRDKLKADLGEATSRLAETAALSDEVAAAAASLEAEQELRRAAEARAASLQLELQSAQDSVRELEKSMSGFKRRSSTLAGSLKSEKSQSSDLAETLAKVRREAAGHAESAAQLRERLDDTGDETIRLQQALDHDRADHARLLGKAAAEKAALEDELAVAEVKARECEEDIEGLRERVMELTQSKVDFFDKAESVTRALEQKMTGSEWEDDGRVTSCRGCVQKFGLMRRRHHCRSCGKIFCTECAGTFMKLPGHKDPQRVCMGCHGTIAAMTKPEDPGTSKHPV
jgi:chromosome segregation ATPase